LEISPARTTRILCRVRMGWLRNRIKWLTHPFLVRASNFYYRKPRPYSYKGITVLVHPEVFPPHLTLSTKIFLDFLAPLELTDRKLLELGCGSGIISLYARQKGAIVTASDINPIALEYLEKASKANNLELRCVQSDLFDGLQNDSFDYIIINPPYYPKKAQNIKEQAWFCGVEFEYFHKLFKQLPEYCSKQNHIYMILSEDCAIKHIKKIAADNNLNMKIIHKKKSMGEQNWIFEILMRAKSHKLP